VKTLDPDLNAGDACIALQAGIKALEQGFDGRRLA
jgi:hypothetical protein